MNNQGIILYSFYHSFLRAGSAEVRLCTSIDWGYKIWVNAFKR